MMQHTTRLTSSYLGKAIIGLCAAVLAAVLASGMLAQPAYAVTAAQKQAEAEEALASLNSMQETLDKLSAEYGEAQMAQEKAEKNCEAAEKRIEEINTQLGDLQVRLNQRARDMYRSGNVAFLEIILGASTFEEFATSLDMVSKVNQSDADMIDQDRNLKKEAEEQAAVYDEQAEIAKQKSKEAEEAAERAQATVAEMQATYDSLSAEAAQLLEEERKAREAEEAARAAAVLAEAQRKAEEEARAAAAEQANQTVVDEGGAASGESASAQSPDAQQNGENAQSGNAENANGEAANTENAEQNNENAEQNTENAEAPAASEPAYEGGDDTVSRAQACLGAPYVWGGVGPGGYDCSGLVSYALTGSHSRLGTTYTFMGWPQVANPQPGDIAVNWSHTGVYIGNGQMIHAATYGVGVITGPVQSGMIFVRYPG